MTAITSRANTAWLGEKEVPRGVGTDSPRSSGAPFAPLHLFTRITVQKIERGKPMQSYWRVVIDLRSSVCRCGAPKIPKQFLCRNCYWSLPETYRKRLWRRYSTQNAVCTIYTRALAFLELLAPTKGELV